MTTDTWVGGSGNWTDGVDWSTGSEPGATDSVVIGASGSDVTLNTAVTVASITLGSAGVPSPTLDIENSTGADIVAGGFTNYGNLSVDADASARKSNFSVGGTLTNESGGIVQIGNASGSGTTLTVAGLINGSGASFSASGSSAAHTVVLEITGGTNAFSSNAGSFNLTYAAALTLNESVSFTNASTGTFGIQDDTALTVDGGFANSGKLDVDSAGGEGGSSLTVTGALSNSKTIQVGNASGSDTTLSVGDLSNESGAHFSASGSSGHKVTLDITGGTGAFSSNDGSFNLTYATALTLNESGSFNNAGTGIFGIHNDTTLTVDGGFSNSGTLDVDSASGEAGSSLTVTGVLNNTNIVQVGNASGSGTTLTVHSIINGSDASFSASGSSGHDVTLDITGGMDAFSSNAGLFKLTYAAALTLNESSGFTNASTGTFGIHDDTALTVDGGFSNSGTLDVDSASGEGGSKLTVTGALSNANTIQVGDDASGSGTTLSVGGLSNGSGAIFSATGSSGHKVTLDITGGTGAFSSNAGSFNLTYAAALTLNESASFTNASAGIFGIHDDTVLTVDGGFANSGILDVDSASGEGGSSLTVTATLGNTKTVQVGNGSGSGTTLTVGELTNGSDASFSAIGSSGHNVMIGITGGSNAFSSNAGMFELTYAAALTLNESSSFSNTGTFGIHNDTTLTVDGGFANSGTLDVDSASGERGSSLMVTGTLNNSKAVQLGNAGGSGTTLTVYSLINDSDASFIASGSSGHDVTLDITGGTDAYSSNAGMFELTYAAALTLTESNSFTNDSSGTFDIFKSTTLTVDGGFANNGMLNVDSGVGEGGSKLTVTGALSNANTIEVGNASGSGTTLSVGGLSNGSGATFSASGSSGHKVTLDITGGTDAFSSNAGSFNLTYAAAVTLTESNSFTNSIAGTFGIHDDTDLTVDGSFANGGTLNVDSGPGEGGSQLTVTGALNNTRTIQVSNSAPNASTTLTVGSLTNASGASLSLNGSAKNIVKLAFTGGADSFSSNVGTFNMTHGAMSLTESSSFSNTGTFDIHDSTLTVDGGFTNNRILNLDSGTSAGGSKLTVTGVLNNTGTIQAGSSSLDASTTLTLGSLSNISGASLNLTGSSAKNIVKLAFTGGADSFSANAGTFSLTHGSMSLTESSSFSNAGIFGIANDTTLTIDGGFANSETLNVDFGPGGGGSKLTVTGALNNTGIIQVGNSTLDASTILTLGSLTNASGASLSLNGSAKKIVKLTFTDGTDSFSANAGTFNMTHGAMSLTESSSFSNTGTFDIHNSTLTVDGGFDNSSEMLNVDSGTGGGGSQLTVTGALNNTGTIQVGNSTLDASTTLTLGSLTNASGASLALNGSAKKIVKLAFTGGADSFSINAGTFNLSHGAMSLTESSSFSNTGIFGIHNDTTLTVDGGFANSETLNVDSGTGEGGSKLTVTGALNNSGIIEVGNITLDASTVLTLGSLSNASGAILTLTGSSAKNVVKLEFTGGADSFANNAGAFNLSHGAMTLNESSSFSNTGTFGIHNDTTLTVDGGFANSGMLNVDSGAGEGGSKLTVTGALNNTGIIKVGNSTLDASTILTLGSLTNGPGASLTLAGSSSNDIAALHVSGDVDNDGAFTAQEDTSLAVDGNLTNATDSNMSVASSSGNAAILTIGGNFTNADAGTFNLDSGPSEGGSDFTVTGTFDNTGSVQIGNSTLSAATNLTLGTLDNESGATFVLKGSPKYGVTIDITGSGSSAGTLDVGSNIHFTGAGSVFTETAGETYVTGSLSSSTIALDGGTLDGTGTVTGAVESTSGAIAGGSVGNADPGTLTINGNYVTRSHQSKQGGMSTVIELLSGTGAGQVGTIAVTGVVNLQGGTLQVDAVDGFTLSSGQVFNNIMTFTPGDLQGSFSELEVGNQTGTGTFVNLGNGLTLGALYNVAAGNITLEVVSTPATTADTWNGTTGNWSAASDWSAQVPTFYSDVTIGARSVVTLSQDATIDSLTLKPGATLNGSGSSLTVGANVAVESNAALTITNLAVGGTFTDNGSVAISGDGTLDLLQGGTIGATGSLALGGGTIAGVSLTADSGSTLSGSGEVDVVFAGAGTVSATGGSWVFTGTGDSFSGVINGNGGVLIGGASTFSGLTIGGTVTVTNNSVITETGQVTLGDATSAAATFVNTVGNSYDIAADVGIGAGAAAGSLFENAGTLAKTAGTGTSTIAVAVFDSGVIQAAIGTLDLTNAVSGTGTMTVGANAALELTSSAASTLTMNFNGADATLELSTPSTFAATIGGFVGSDIIDLSKIIATAATLNASDQLVITDGAATVATLQLTGNYAGDTFAAGTDGHGGTDITTTAPQGAAGPFATSNGALSFSFDQDGRSFTSTGESANISILNNTADDTFNFDGHFGKITIAGYAPGHDTLNFGHDDLANAAAVEAHTMQDSHGNTIIALDPADTITIEGVTPVQFEAQSADWYFI